MPVTAESYFSALWDNRDFRVVVRGSLFERLFAHRHLIGIVGAVSDTRTPEQEADRAASWSRDALEQRTRETGQSR